MNTYVNIPEWFDETLLCSKLDILERFEQHVLGVPEERRIFIDNGGDILIICHMDTVQLPKLNSITHDRIYAAGLDDRLGIMLAIHAVQKYGVNADILICDFEEQARSTAQYHELKDYNWIIELDRMGKDYVDYGLCSPSFHQNMLKLAIPIGYGSFSDISFLRTNISCVNLGIGYYDAHGINSYCIIKETDLALERLVTLYDLYGHIQYKQLTRHTRIIGSYNSSRQSYSHLYPEYDWV